VSQRTPQQEEQSATGPSPSAVATRPSKNSKNPFSKLFQPRPRELQELLRATQLPDQAPTPTLPPGAHEPQIDCKIRVTVVDPSIDRGIQMSKRSAETRFAIRFLEHPCLKR
jgi:hypothetical protein